MSRQIMQQALEAIKLHLLHHEHGCVYLNPVMYALEAELAKPEQPDLRKAAEMALEWMEVTHHTAMTTFSDEAYEEHCNVEKELRQALARPEFDTPESHIVKWSIPVDPNIFGEALAQPEQEPVVTDKDGSPCPEFWDWLPKAYNFEGNGTFTKYNMEVAFLAGKNTALAQPKHPMRSGQKLLRS